MLSGLLGRVFGPLKHDKFLRATGALVGGTAAAQGLGLLALPLLTRFYRPEDFSVLAGYVAILTMASTVAGMRFDTAIPLPEDDDTAKNLLTLALTSIAAIVIIAVLLIYFTGQLLAQAMGRPEIEPYLWLVPFGIGLTAVYTAFQYMATRSKAFPLIARTKLTQAFTGLCAQIGLGWMGVAPLGLLLGHALMSGAGVVALARKSRRGGDYAATVSRQSLWRTAKTYRRFPQYSVAEELANNAGIQLPILLITAMLVGPEGGLLFLAMRAIGMPLSIVGNAVAQVYYSEAAQYARTGTLARETSSVFKRLSRLLVLPMLAVGPFAPDLFRIAFGSEWERAGVIVLMMIPWYAFRLIASPISMVMYVGMRQRMMLAMTVGGLALRVLPLLVALSYAPAYATATFAVSSALFYAGIVIVFLKVAGLTTASLIRLLFGELLLWVLVGAGAFVVYEVLSHA